MDYLDEIKEEAVAIGWKLNSKVALWPRISSRLGEWSGSQPAAPNQRKLRKICDMEDELVELFKQKRKEGKPVSWDLIVAQAQELSGTPLFKAPKSWFANLKKRAKLSLRVGTKVIQKLSEDQTAQIWQFMHNIRKQRVDYEEKQGSKLRFWRYWSSFFWVWPE